MNGKICNCCKTFLPFEDFVKSKSKKDHYWYYCKTCVREKTRSYLADPEYRERARKKAEIKRRALGKKPVYRPVTLDINGTPVSKICSKCKEDRPIKEFLFKKHLVQPKCKTCRCQPPREKRPKPFKIPIKLKGYFKCKKCQILFKNELKQRNYLCLDCRTIIDQEKDKIRQKYIPKKSRKDRPLPQNPHNKVCSKCHGEFGKSNFHKHKNTPDHLSPSCKNCARQKYELSRDKILLNIKEYYLKFPEKRRETQRIQSKKPEKRIARNTRNRIKDAIKRKNLNYNGKILKATCCNSTFLKQYLESLFQEGMTWDNYGFYGWHIDHIKPLSSFDLSDPVQISLANHWTNLQPLWAKDNLSKSNKINYPAL
jgi:hypothetical protein